MNSAGDIQQPPASHISCSLHQLQICEVGHEGRQELESFVRTAFARRHGASLHAFMPTLLALRGDDGRLCGVAGFRSAFTQPLFLEHYFDEPIERVLSNAVGRNIERHQIVEAGNLAGTSCRAACRLVLELPQILFDRGHEWLVFTATDAIRKLLSAYQAPVVELAQALASRVVESGDDWGRYYTTDPRVMAAYLPASLKLRRGRRREP